MYRTEKSIIEGVSVGNDRQPVIWFEVEDFIRYFDHFRNPTGVQRVAFEIFVEAERIYGPNGRIRFCRLSVYNKQLMPIDFDEVISAYLNPPGANAPWKTISEPARFLSKFSNVLRVLTRNPRFFYGIMKTAVHDFVDLALRRRRFDRLVQPGDIVVSLGASWGIPGYMEHIAKAKQRYGIKFSVLISDLIPIENESLVEQWHVLQFRKWIEEAIANSDVLLNVSKYSRNAVVDLATGAGWPLPRVEVLDLGTGLSDRTIAGDRGTISLPQRYVLVVSTIEVRKNHRLLVRIWRRLIERHGADAIPVMVFAGQIGWMVNDLLDDLAASNYLEGKMCSSTTCRTQNCARRIALACLRCFRASARVGGCRLPRALYRASSALLQTAHRFRKWVAILSIISIPRMRTKRWQKLNGCCLILPIW